MNRDASFLPNLRHLAATVAVLHRGSVSAAARAIHLTQPAVTQAVANIEAELGGCVFDRSAFGVSATPAGRRAGLRLERALEHVSTGLTEAGASRAEGGSRAEYRVTATQLKAVAEVAAAGGIAPLVPPPPLPPAAPPAPAPKWWRWRWTFPRTGTCGATAHTRSP
jgi:hypothetical protein